MQNTDLKARQRHVARVSQPISGGRRRRTGSCADLTRFAIQAKGPYGKWTRKPLAYRESKNVHLRVTHPSEICVNLVFKHIHAASSYTIVDNLFHSFIFHCEKEYFLIYNLH